MHHAFPVGPHEAPVLLRAKSFLVELDGFKAVRNSQVRCDRVISIWNWFCHNFFLWLIDKWQPSSTQRKTPVNFCEFFFVWELSENGPIFQGWVTLEIWKRSVAALASRSKAPEDWRTPKPGGIRCTLEPREASWSAAVLWRAFASRGVAT